MQQHPNAAVTREGKAALGVRNDGMLVPYTPQVQRAMADVRPYWGDPKATTDQILEYLNGGLTTVEAAKQAGLSAQMQDAGKLDVASATKEQLAHFALNEFAVNLAPDQTLKAMRAAVQKLIDEA